MTKDEFLAGKYGVSHGVITLIGTLVFTGIGALIGQNSNNLKIGMTIGNGVGAISMVIFYYSREVAQGHSYNPNKWPKDGRFDLLVSIFVAFVATIIFAAVINFYEV